MGWHLIWSGRVISGLLACLLAMSAAMKLVGGREVIEGFARMGLPESLRVPLGVLELVGVLVYVVPVTSVMGTILLTGYVGGAIVTHLRIDEPLVFQIALGLLVWLGLYLRESRLKSLLPLRT